MQRSPRLIRHTVFITPLLLALASAAVLAPLPAQAAPAVAAGKAATEQRTVPEFQALALQAPVDVVVRQGTPQSVTLTGDEQLLARLETVVEGSAGAGKSGGVPTLVLRWKRENGLSMNSYLGRTPLRATVVLPQLSALAVAGSGDLTLQPFKTPRLMVSVAGSGDIVLDTLSSDELQVSLAGSGDVRGSGKATRLQVQVAGSGDVQLADLRADNVTVNLAGSGDVAVQAQSSLTASIVGSGDITYTGAAKVTRAITGSGTVRQR